MKIDAPLAYLITWTVYGTFLQGDRRGWTKWGRGTQAPQTRMAEWRAERLKHPAICLDADQRIIVESEISRLCDYRGWKLWARNARTNHVHVVVSASLYSGSIVRDQFKANCTRVLRNASAMLLDRPVWTRGGDWKCINTDDELENAIYYVTNSQDLKHLDQSTQHLPSAAMR